jgi:hypothetical protein
MTLYDSDFEDESNPFEEEESQMYGITKLERFDKRELTNARSRLRNAISRDFLKSEERQKKMAASIIHEAAERYKLLNDPSERNRRVSQSLVYGLSQLGSKVAATMGVTPRVSVKAWGCSEIVSGRTDFETIEIRVDPNFYNPDDPSSVLTLINCTKGVVYHEIGHIKFTVPFNVLIRKSEEYSRDRLIYNEKFLLNYKESAAMYNTAMSLAQLSNAWNILEDQRMETAMCTFSPIMSKYFTSIVDNVVICKENLGSNWPFIVGRTYLPAELRQLIRNEAENHKAADLIDEINKCVMTYRSSRSYDEMLTCAIKFAQIMVVWGINLNSVDRHDYYHGNDNTAPTPDSIPNTKEFNIESKNESNREPTNGTTANSKEPGASKNSTPSNQNENLSREDSEAVENFVGVVNDAMAKEVVPNDTCVDMQGNEVQESIKVADKMLSALEELVAQSEPSWAFRQEEGVLDPTAYLLREPGDTDFWSGLIGDTAPGHNLAVSVLLDTSSSMGSDTRELSIAGVGIKKACYELGIPCTITTFDDDVASVFEGEEAPKFVEVGARGGTHVMQALLAMETQTFGKAYHLVIIITDGEWSDVHTLSPWTSPHRNIMLVGFGENLRSSIQKKDADSSIVITNPLELPGLVTNALVGYFV